MKKLLGTLDDPLDLRHPINKKGLLSISQQHINKIESLYGIIRWRKKTLQISSFCCRLWFCKKATCPFAKLKNDVKRKQLWINDELYKIMNNQWYMVVSIAKKHYQICCMIILSWWPDLITRWSCSRCNPRKNAIRITYRHALNCNHK